MRKQIAISKNVDRAVKLVRRAESNRYIKHSYSKILNYLVVLGIDRYLSLSPKNQKVLREPLPFDFDRYSRRKK